MDIIKWGSDYLLKTFVPKTSATSDTILYSQVGVVGNDTKTPNDMNCWQRPEDMNYPRPVSQCSSRASDLAGEIVAALSAASLVLNEDNNYSKELANSAEILFQFASKVDPTQQGTYTGFDECGKESRKVYNSTGYIDELVWGGTWLAFATGNVSYLEYATNKFSSAVSNETSFDKGIFYWNNKVTANVVLLTRLRFFKDLGNPYEGTLMQSSKMAEELMCAYLSGFQKTPGGLILQRPENGLLLQFAATASFLSKLYSDYLKLVQRSGGSCSNSGGFSVEMLKIFSLSQASTSYQTTLDMFATFFSFERLKKIKKLLSQTSKIMSKCF